MTSSTKKLLMAALIATMLILAFAIVLQGGGGVASADSANAGSSQPDSVAASESGIVLNGEAFVYAGEEYTYSAAGAAFIIIDVAGNADVTSLDVSAIGGTFFKKVVVSADALPFTTFTVTASSPITSEATAMTVTIMPLYATDIGEVALKVGDSVLDKNNPMARPGDTVEVSIKKFVIDDQIYGLASNVTFSDFAVTIVTTQYARSGDYNSSVIINERFSEDNPVLIFNVVVIQYNAPEEFRRLVKNVEVDIYIPVESIGIVGISDDVHRNQELTYQVKYNGADYDVASEKGYDILVTDLGGKPIDSAGHFSLKNDDKLTGFKVAVAKRAPYGAGLKIRVTSKDDRSVTDEISLTVKELESSFALEYSGDYPGAENQNNGIQLLDFNDKTQLRASYSADIYLIGGTTGTRYTFDKLRAFGLDVEILQAQANDMFSTGIDGKISIHGNAPAYTGSARTVYGYKVKVKDGAKSYPDINKKVEVFRPLGNSTGGTIDISTMGGSTGLNIVGALNSIAFIPQGNNFSAREATDFDYTINSPSFEISKSDWSVTLTLKNNAPLAISYTYNITVRNALSYNEVNIDANWKKVVTVNRRFLSSYFHFIVLTDRPSDERYYMLCDVDFAGLDWSPKDFAATLDGQYYSIKNLKIEETSVPTSGAYGLFRDLKSTAVVKNLYLEDVSIYFSPDHSSVQCNVGGLAGSNYGLIQNVAVYGDIQVHRVNSFMGGIVGKNYAGGTIKKCRNYARLQGNGDMGGIAGQNYAGTWNDGKGIIDCTNYAEYYLYIIQTRSVGGIVAYNQGAILGCNNYGKFYFENKDTSRGSAQYDYRCIPAEKSLQPRVGGIVGHNRSSYFDQTGSRGTYAGFTYKTGPGYNQLAYFYKHYGERAGRID